MTKTTFTITENHLKLLRRMYVGWQDCCTGSPEIDPKRPYGNSYVPGDVADIIGLRYNIELGLTEKQEQKLLALHKETELALQIVLVTGQFKTGKFVQRDDCYRRGWERV